MNLALPSLATDPQIIHSLASLQRRQIPSSRLDTSLNNPESRLQSSYDTASPRPHIDTLMMRRLSFGLDPFQPCIFPHHTATTIDRWPTSASGFLLCLILRDQSDVSSSIAIPGQPKTCPRQHHLDRRTFVPFAQAPFNNLTAFSSTTSPNPGAHHLSTATFFAKPLVENHPHHFETRPV